MQARGDRTQDTARLVVITGRDHRRQAARADGAFQQECMIVLRQDARRAIAIPPRHQPAAATLLFRAGDLQHGRLAVVPDGHKQA